jgi:hypothetical protein
MFEIRVYLFVIHIPFSIETLSTADSVNQIEDDMELYRIQ